MKRRMTGIELMRIIMMLLVVLHHYASHGFAGVETTVDNRELLNLMTIGARLAINCFILTTGYFGIMNSTDTRGKVLRLWKDRLFYSVLISVVLLAVGEAVFDVSYVCRAIFPTITCRHNYVTTFILLYLFIPYLNKFLRALSMEEMKKFCILATIIISVIPTVMKLTPLYTDNVYSYLMWMVYVYCLGAYIRLSELKLPYGWLSLATAFVMIFVTMVVEPKAAAIPGLYSTGSQFHIIPLLGSIAVFGFFANLNMKPSRIINGLAASSFAVLLIHDDPLVRNIVWKRIFRTDLYGTSDYLLLHAIATVLIIYLVCVAIDKIYVFGNKRLAGLLHRK